MSSEIRVTGHRVPTATAKGSEKSNSSKAVEQNSVEMTEVSTKSPNKARFAGTKMPALAKDDTAPQKLAPAVQSLLDEVGKMTPVVFDHLKEHNPDLYSHIMQTLAKGNPTLGGDGTGNLEWHLPWPFGHRHPKPLNPASTPLTPPTPPTPPAPRAGREDVNIFALLAQVNNDAIQGNFQAVQGYNAQMKVGSDQLDQENATMQSNLSTYQSDIKGKDVDNSDGVWSNAVGALVITAGVVAILFGIAVAVGTLGGGTPVAAALIGGGIALIVVGIGMPVTMTAVDDGKTDTNIGSSSMQMQAQTAMSSNAAEVENRSISTAQQNTTNAISQIDADEQQIANSCSNLTKVNSLGNFSGS